MPKVTFPSRRITGLCAEGETILEAIRELGYILDHACGGNALCGTCCVKVVAAPGGLSPVLPDERERLEELGVTAPHRLSCQARVLGDIVVLPAV